jgi:regulator of nucleoside diphosphate kinase
MPDVLPEVVIPDSERDRLQRLARDAASEGHPVATFLATELARAATAPSVSDDMAAIVTMGSWVKYRIDWGFPAEVKRLVYPEEFTSRRNEVSVLSPIGAALLGLRAGSRMLFQGADGRAHVVSVECVDRSAPVVPLFPITRHIRLPDPDDDPFDPNPAA